MENVEKIERESKHNIESEAIEINDGTKNENENSHAHRQQHSNFKPLHHVICFSSPLGTNNQQGFSPTFTKG
jgi:hypothetical protein